MKLSLRMRLSVWVAVLTFSATAFGQTTGTIRGAVKDPAGLAVVGAKVTAILGATGVSHVTSTNGTGDYEFPVLPVGSYTLQVEAAGFKKYVQQEVDVTLGHAHGGLGRDASPWNAPTPSPMRRSARSVTPHGRYAVGRASTISTLRC